METHEPPATYAQYCLLPADTPRYEILEGVGYLTPAPGSKHQQICANIHRRLDRYVLDQGLGQVYFAPLDVVLSETNLVQPDLLFIGHERQGIIRARGVFGPPDLVVEILSASTAQRDREQKLALYRRYGVRECWLVDEARRAVEVWRSGKTALDVNQVFTGAEPAASALLSGFTLGLSEIFAGVDKIPEE